MDQGPLVKEEIDAGEELARQFNEYLPVKAAFWLKPSDGPYRYLHIASEGINDQNLDVGYGEVLRLANRMRSPYMNPFRVKLLSADNPLARAAAEINERFPGNIATRFEGESFGGIGVEDVYVYPALKSTAAT